MRINTFEDVVSWQKARELYVDLFRDFKNSKEYAFKDQLLRATLSISNNIAEGFDRGYQKELRQFLIIALGSAAEVRSMLEIAKDIDILNEDDCGKHTGTVKDISKLLTGFIKSIKQNTEV